ncbi:MAG: peptide chain release factor N(5)-glutamine methyltransferase [Alphaproteobacteria bacterium]|nr:peptide chain release factor N(5)-glutamine methyltransferase [Alphaproteobacteria bacterium]MBN2674897.1 peptide chain release factor N(5)-glutamine methyltransferase [Alphaproteobacteria bacterium]
MTLNQAFEILKNAGGINAARIIIKNWKKLPRFRILWAAKQLRRGVPVAKIIHEKWFYGLNFYTNKWTLDPRPDTETLVEAVLKEHKKNETNQIKILDLGTGTGCLVASIIKNLPNASGIGIDKSFFAVRVARKNIKNFGLKDKIKIIKNNFNSKLSIGKFDIIVSNPPYIAPGDKNVNEGAKHDPKIALYAKNNGMAAYEVIAKNSPLWLKPGGKIYLEIGKDQGLDVRDIFVHQGWNFIESFDDLSGIERVLIFGR